MNIQGQSLVAYSLRTTFERVFVGCFLLGVCRAELLTFELKSSALVKPVLEKYFPFGAWLACLAIRS